jgi:ribonuclease T
MQDFDIWNAAREGAKSALRVAQEFEHWIERLAPDPATRCFVANPVAFDWPWINELFLKYRGTNPFGYRALCIRSMHYGMFPSAIWGGDREAWGDFHVPSQAPHHALHDAVAQAKELIGLLEYRG